MKFLNINKYTIVEEALEIIQEAKSVNGPKNPVNHKTGANSTASDTSTEKCASPYFESALTKTVEDNDDLSKDNMAEKKEIKTRMVD